jgi:hypothetical protein
MPSEKCTFQGRTGIQQLERVGAYVVIANRWLHEIGVARRYTLVDEARLSVHSVHGSQYAAVVFAKKHVR